MAIDTATGSSLKANNPARPVLTHLTADTSWLISLPQALKRHDTPNKQRAYFHILLDPWFNGEITVMSRWFIAFQHTVQAKCQSMEDVRRIVHGLESSMRTSESVSEDECEVDLILISHYLPDHLHLPSLKQVSPEVPVLTVDLAVQEIQAAKHFQTVSAMPDIGLAAPETLWKSDSAISFLPPWLRIGRLPSGEKYPELHFATLLAFNVDGAHLNTSNTAPETMLYTPHGIYADRLDSLDSQRQTGKSNMLAVLHGLDPAWSPQVSNLGVKNGFQIASKTKSRYWIPTHDEHMQYKGILGMMQRKDKKTFADALVDGADLQDNKIGDLHCRELGNGESFVLV